MSSCLVAYIVLLLFVFNVHSRRLSQELKIRLLWDKISDKISDTIKDNPFNKFHSDVRHFDKEEMIFFPDVAFQSLDNDNTWKIMIHGWRYEGNKGKDWFGFRTTQWVERIAKHLMDQDAILYLNGSINRDRLKPFFVEDESNELITIKIGEKTYSLRTDQHGEIYEQIQATNDDIQKLKQQQQQSSNMITYDAVGDNQDQAKGVIHLIEPRQGISVISDVDDTIKISEVLDKVRLLANTFIHPFKPVPGMSELYQKWYKSNNNCTFHYLSGMPDQLYTLTQEFIDTNNFPDGSFHMRHFGWAAASLFDFLHSEATFNHKMIYLRFFISNTIRSFVLVGDSGEKDPEIYGTITREYPDRIRSIFIRAIKGEKFDDARFVNAFEGISKDKWQVFDDPNQVPTDLSQAPKAIVA